MNNELFKPEEVTKKSPRLLWMEKYNLETINCDSIDPDAWDEDVYPWVCKQKQHGEYWRDGFGNTEDEAITAWAMKNNLKLWNEIV